MQTLDEIDVRVALKVSGQPHGCNVCQGATRLVDVNLAEQTQLEVCVDCGAEMMWNRHGCFFVNNQTLQGLIPSPEGMEHIFSRLYPARINA